LQCERDLAKATEEQNAEEMQLHQETLNNWHKELAKWEGKMQAKELVELCQQRLRQLEQKLQNADATDSAEAEKIATYQLKIPMWQEYLAANQSKLGGGAVGNVAPSAYNHVSLALALTPFARCGTSGAC